MLMVMCMKETGMMIKHMVMGFIYIMMERGMKENGWMINRWDRGLRHGLMDRLTKETIIME